ncbi:prenyltransferase/squalene oxidase repeat-containing protein [Streptomyces sp. LaPpAH-108]|uniref:prenyltransferase/squalene oxidase repeat-containing protein n=1 Tax=Streptomyces sp. LaPpAH-108 TaxID=1155714 RepID=UPI00037C96C5|nr:prenyltransferase/squalene oxidase repeat-containing protein [Streptomyces sp. LaPpAH-108]
MHRVPSGRPGGGRTAAVATAFLLASATGVSLWASALPAHADTLTPAAPSASATAQVRASAVRAATPDLEKGTAYLVAPAQLTDGHYYEPFGGGFADFGLTIDGAYALAATRKNDAAFTKIVDFLDQRKTDGTGRTVNDWTGIGTSYASGGAIGKEALLAEVAGKDPRAFGGQDLIAALDKAVCAEASTADTSCAAPGAYTYAPSVFSQSLGVMAQLRAGDDSNATAPVAYLKKLQNANGSWPSLIPSTGDSDVDSTAMAVMALALLPDDEAASDAVAKGVAWIAKQQKADGGFPGAAGDSTNSAGLAVQGLSLDADTYQAQITKTLAFLAGQQNDDGGFNVAADGQQGSDVRASTQALGGSTGISFGTLSLTTQTSPPPESPSPTASPTPTPTKKPSPTASDTTATPTISTVPDTPTPSDTSTAPAPVTPTTDTPAPTPGELAATGTDARTETLLAAALLLTGATTITAARRRVRPARHR